MASTTITVDAAPETVWDLLADPATYALWVVGNKSIRGYDRSWPAPGSEFQHKVGFGPIAVKDKTVSVESETPHRLVMLVRALPFLRAKVTFTIAAEGYGTCITMEERPHGGPWEKIWNPMLDWVTVLRNAETLRRLKQLAEVRAGAVHH